MTKRKTISVTLQEFQGQPIIVLEVNPKKTIWSPAQALHIAADINHQAERAIFPSDLDVSIPGRIELRPAYNWTCEECGKDQFERVISRKMSEGQLAEYFEDNPGFDGDVDMLFTTSFPTQVFCQDCGSEYETQPYTAKLTQDDDEF